MRNLFTYALLFVGTVFGNSQLSAPNAGATFRIDMSSANVGTSYSQLAGPLTNQQSFEVCTTSATVAPLQGCSVGTAASCSGCTANFVIPAGGCASSGRDQIQVGKYLCVKTFTGTASAGWVFGAVR